jgi:hypothetical protein
MSKSSAPTKATYKAPGVLDSNVINYSKRLLVGTATTGNIRMEWAAARYSQIIPANWSKVDMTQFVNGFVPLRYSVADAQNLIVQKAVQDGFEWLLLVEHDTMPPPDGLVRFNEYMRSNKYPVVSGLYFTRSDPAEPMVYRGRGNSYYTNWKLGDLVMADGVPTGMLLINMKLMRAIYDDSPEYNAGGIIVRRVFDTPVKTWFNEETGAQEALVGTSDLDWCQRIKEGGYLAQAGYKHLANEEYPFVIDTNIACNHIDPDGTQFPIGGIPEWCRNNGCL